MRFDRLDSDIQSRLQQGAVLRARDLAARGVSRALLSRLVASGELARVGRGLYALAGVEGDTNRELAQVSLRVPHAVVGLLSALRFHDLTAESPHEVWVLLPRGARRPRLDYPPIRVSWVAPALIAEGVDEHLIDDVVVRVTSPARTVAELFRHRNRVGIDVAVDALRALLARYRGVRPELRRMAALLRVENVMRPYLEALS